MENSVRFLLILLVLGGVIAVTAVFYFSRQWMQAIETSWRTVGEQLGLTLERRGVYFELRGRLQRVEVVVDVMQQQMANHSRPWTRVRAQLTQPPPLQVRARTHKVADEPPWPSVPSGNPAFDAKYELFLPEGVAVEEGLKTAVSAALLAADPPVHILNNVVLWTQVRVVRDATLLQHAVESCANVAAALEEEK